MVQSIHSHRWNDGHVCWSFGMLNAATLRVKFGGEIFRTLNRQSAMLARMGQKLRITESQNQRITESQNRRIRESDKNHRNKGGVQVRLACGPHEIEPASSENIKGQATAQSRPVDSMWINYIVAGVLANNNTWHDTGQVAICWDVCLRWQMTFHRTTNQPLRAQDPIVPGRPTILAMTTAIFQAKHPITTDHHRSPTIKCNNKLLIGGREMLLPTVAVSARPSFFRAIPWQGDETVPGIQCNGELFMDLKFGSPANECYEILDSLSSKPSWLQPSD